MSAAVVERIRQVFEKTTGNKGVDAATRFRDIPAWDSLRLAEFIIALQREFKLRLTPTEISCFECLQKVDEVVQSALKRQA